MPSEMSTSNKIGYISRISNKIINLNIALNYINHKSNNYISMNNINNISRHTIKYNIMSIIRSMNKYFRNIMNVNRNMWKTINMNIISSFIDNLVFILSF